MSDAPETTSEKVVGVIHKHLYLVERPAREAVIHELPEVDSLDYTELLIELEEQFDVDLADFDARDSATVGAVADEIDAQVRAKAAA